MSDVPPVPAKLIAGTSRVRATSTVRAAVLRDLAWTMKVLLISAKWIQ